MMLIFHTDKGLGRCRPRSGAVWSESFCLQLLDKFLNGKITVFNFRIITIFASLSAPAPVSVSSLLDMTKPAKWHVPSEDSDQPGHPPSLIRVLVVYIKKVWIPSYPLNAQRRLIRLGGSPGWSESSLDAQWFCWFCHAAAHFSK